VFCACADTSSRNVGVHFIFYYTIRIKVKISVLVTRNKASPSVSNDEVTDSLLCGPFHDSSGDMLELADTEEVRKSWKSCRRGSAQKGA